MKQIEAEINRVALRFARQRLQALNIRRARAGEQTTSRRDETTSRRDENRAVEVRIEYTDDAAPPVTRGPKPEVDRIRELLERTGQAELTERR